MKIRLTQDIFDDGQDHHPPGMLALKGEELVVRSVYDAGYLAVSHAHRTDASFIVFDGEYEMLPEV